ncbi:MAG TPA: glycogen synthase [Chitinophagaceae bacterium]|nr:glycogen synthase [Chitinophagaceae bacterium]
MEVLHISAECYPVAKVGGLGDVVGALPKYQHELGWISKVVMPCYKTGFLLDNAFDLVHQGGSWLGQTWFHFNVLKEKTNRLGFDLYLLDIPGLLDRERVYSYPDDPERFTAFQIAVLDWLSQWHHQPDIVHCHDHHSGLVPFMMAHSFRYQQLRDIPTVLTIHNAQYQGQFGWDHLNYIPGFDLWRSGMLDWGGLINPLAAGIKSCWRLTAVSPSYLEELTFAAAGLDSLFRTERAKSSGILNGIDTRVWDPETDPMMEKNFGLTQSGPGKKINKESLCHTFGLDPGKPLFSFVGRLVAEKGADLLTDIIGRSLYETGNAASFLVLGSGDPHLEWLLNDFKWRHEGNFNVYIGYQEHLSHLIYAGSDFLMMPSRVEPCGLNQMYALRYGTMPMVHSTGGLRDTVTDFGDPGGFGIRFDQASVWDVCYSIKRALELYQNPRRLQALRKVMMKLDHSWDQSAATYISLYSQIK